MLISFILPIYNVEPYLSTCLDSILNQGIDKDDFEIILVEDCSTDGSLQICKDYSCKYKNIILIENNKNIGRGLTRNKGIACARGEYIHFVDSDDYLFPNSIQELLSIDIIKQSPDIIRFESRSTTDISKGINNVIFKGKYNEYCSPSPALSAWSYWFKRLFLIENNLYFTDKETGQDAIFTFSALSQNPFIIVGTTIVYYYRRHNQQVTENKDIKYVNCLFEVANEITRISTNSNLYTLYITEIYKDTIHRFYRSQRTLKECIIFKNNLKEHTLLYNTIIKEGFWYLQLSRVPVLLYFYLKIKKNKFNTSLFHPILSLLKK